MADMPTTRASLLVRLRDAADEGAWREFVRFYAPLIYAYARRRQLQDADAADVTQEVLRSVAGAARGFDYDPRRGSFRGWLFTVTRNKLLDFRARQRRGRGAGGTSAQDRLEQELDLHEATQWDQEYERRIFNLAAEEVRKEFEDATWRAFWQTAVEGRKPQEVAASLGISVGAVYIAKTRAQGRLKAVVAELMNAEGEA